MERPGACGITLKVECYFCCICAEILDSLTLLTLPYLNFGFEYYDFTSY